VYSSSFGRAGSSQRNFKIIIVGCFSFLLLLAIGVPFISKPKAVVAPPVMVPEDIEIMVPIQKIPSGVAITEQMLKRVKITRQLATQYGDAALKSPATIVNRYSKVPLLPDKPIFIEQLLAGSDNLVTRKITPGFRAVTIRADDVTGIEGWGTPGAKVDVLWISNTSGAGAASEPSITTIVQGAQVLSVAGKVDPTQIGPQSQAGAVKDGPNDKVIEPPAGASGKNTAVLTNFTVTLLVSPEDGKKLHLANATGKLALMLRGDLDSMSAVNRSDTTLTERKLFEGGDTSQAKEQVEGSVKVRRDDGTYDEWSLIQGKVWKWDRENR